MKIAYAIAFVITGICLLFCMYMAQKNDKKIAVVVKKLLLAGLIAVLANIVIVLTTNKSIGMAAYSVFFVCMDWLLYEVFCFALEFSVVEHPKFVNWRLWRILLFLDSGSMLLNPFLKHAFDCEMASTGKGELCFKPVYYGFYKLHLAICYLLVVLAVITLVYKVVKTTEMYRRKYLVVLLILVTIVLSDALYMFTSEVINLSIIAFSIGGILIYYYAVIFIPKELLKNILSMVVQEMQDAIFILDENGKYVHINDRAEEFLREEDKDYAVLEHELSEWFKECTEIKDDRFYNITREKEGKKKYYKVFYHAMRSARGRYQGCFLTIQDRTEEELKLKKERYVARHDALTKVYNKQRFYEKTEAYLRENPEVDYLIVCSDVRNFKLINDVFGSAKGDEMLRTLADTISKNLLEGEICGRLENDRFGILLRQGELREDKFLYGFRKGVDVIKSWFSYPVQICVGVYQVTDRKMPVPVMCDRAFMAISTIKGQYGKDVAFYDETLRETVLQEQVLIGELPDAIENEEFTIYLQPQITKSGEMLGAEALVRWLHPDKGLRVPGEFIEVYERTGLIGKLDRHVWELACKQLVRWKEKGREDLYLSVNISPQDFYFMDVCETLTELVKKYGVSSRNLKLEITETAVMENLEVHLNQMKQLRAAGFAVEMDDFGSGYSSLNMLKDIKVDVLKIDMAFLGRTEDKSRAERILKMIVDLSKDLEIPVITEGVETAEQVAFLEQIGCDMFQGYFFARPMEIDAFEEKYL